MGKGFSRLIALGMVVFSLFWFPPELLALEELQYQVVEHAGDFEIRQYPPYAAAETLVEGGFQKAGNEGFRRLMAYIHGENRQQQVIPLTAPVGQEQAGEKWRITLVMPSSYTKESLPAPLDPRIKLVEVPPTLMAAVRYSGFWNKSLFEAQENRLRAFIGRKGFKVVGAPVFARYKSPFMLWFLRHNEVLIPVAREQ